MRVSILLLALAVAWPLAPEAQVADTTTAARYYPLEIGDTWQYRVVVSDGDALVFRYTLARTVVRDSVIGGERFAVIEQEAYDAPPSMPFPSEPERVLERYDPVTARVVSNEGDSSLMMDNPCPLDADFPDQPDVPYEVTCANDVRSEIAGGYDQAVEVGSESLVLTEKTVFLNGTFSAHWSYAAGIGLVEYSLGEVSSRELTLAFASVGGQTFGTAIVSTADTPEGSGLSLTARPTLTAGPLAVTVAGARGPVLLEAFDVRGRRVLSRTASGDVRLDASAWAPGLYLLRAISGDGSATVRVVRR